MRHRVAHRKLGRVTEHRIAMLRNQADGAASATSRSRRPCRRRRSCGRSSSGSSPSPSAASPPATPTARCCTRAGWSCATSRTATSSASCSTRSRRASQARPGGYTRLLRLGFRRGDSAEVAQVELVGSEYNPNAEAEKTEAAAKAKPKGVGGRLRAAAERLRGKKADAEEGERRAGREQGQAEARSRRATRAAAPRRGARLARRARRERRAELSVSCQNARSSRLQGKLSARCREPPCLVRRASKPIRA